MAVRLQDSLHHISALGSGSLSASLCFYLLSVSVGISAADDCHEECPDLYRPICASDVTYTNWCFLGIARCRNSSITEQYKAECGCSEYKECDWKYEPLCGTDKNDYSNMCEFQVAKACRKNFTLEVAHSGSCKPDPSDPLCRSDTVCPMNYAPVCGSDGRTYGNSCGITAANSCRMDADKIAVLYTGQCSPIDRTWMWVAIVALITLIVVIIVASVCIVKKKKHTYNPHVIFDDEKAGGL